MGGVQETAEGTGVLDTETELVEETVEEVVEDSTEEAKEEPKEEKYETARESAKRAFEELKKQNVGEEGETEEKSDADESPKPQDSKLEAKKGPGRPKKQVFEGKDLDLDDDLEPPSRFTAARKELFKKLPPELKRGINQTVRDLERGMTQANQRAAMQEKESRHVLEAVRPYYVSHPELAEAGITESQLVTRLIAAHQKLTDPKTKRDTFIRLGNEIGFDWNTLGEDGEGADNSAIESHPHVRALEEKITALQQKLNPLVSSLESTERRQFDERVSQITSEIEAARNETDQFGQYLYPKLHDAEYLHSLKSLVSDLAGTVPNLGWGEAWKAVHRTFKEGMDYGAAKWAAIQDLSRRTSGQTKQPTRLPQANTQKRIEAIGASVRGKTSQIPNGFDLGEPPPEALVNARATALWAQRELARRRG